MRRCSEGRRGRRRPDGVRKTSSAACGRGAGAGAASIARRSEAQRGAAAGDGGAQPPLRAEAEIQPVISPAISPTAAAADPATADLVAVRPRLRGAETIRRPRCRRTKTDARDELPEKVPALARRRGAGPQRDLAAPVADEPEEVSPPRTLTRYIRCGKAEQLASRCSSSAQKAKEAIGSGRVGQSGGAASLATVARAVPYRGSQAGARCGAQALRMRRGHAGGGHRGASARAALQRASVRFDRLQSFERGLAEAVKMTTACRVDAQLEAGSCDRSVNFR